jgi:uncharacterized protein HemX
VKPQTILTAALVVALGLFGVSQFRACKLDKKYRDLKAAYETDRKIAEADHALSVAHIAELNNAIASADKVIGQKNADIKAKSDKITLLQRRLDDVVGQEPPTTPEIESMPIVINLRAQIQNLSNMYSLATSIIDDKDEVIAQWSDKFYSMKKIAGEWKGMYDREHALRVNCEGLLGVCESRVPGPWKTIKKVALGVAAGFIAGSLLK